MKIFVSGSLAYDLIMGFPGKFADHICRDRIVARATLGGELPSRTLSVCAAGS